MVRAGTIVMHAPTELAEHKQHHIVGGVVLFEIVVEGTNGLRCLGPQPWLAIWPAWVSKLL